MSKDDGLTLLVYAVMLVAAIFIGLDVIGPAMSDLDLVGASRYIFAIVAILLGALLSSVFFELGHVVGAKLGGYSILSFNVFGLAIYRSKNKWKFGFRRFQGLTGGTEIAPKKEKANPQLYAWGPTIFFMIEVVILLMVYIFTPNTSTPSNPNFGAYAHHIALIIIAVGAMLAIYNITPFKLDTINDGYRLVLLSKSVNREAFNELRRLDALSFNGEPYDQVKTFSTITTMTAEVNLRAIYQLEDQGENEKALELIEALDTSDVKLDPLMLARIYAQKMWVLIMLGRNEEAGELWNGLDAKIHKQIGDDTALETIRAYFLYSGVIAHSVHESIYAINRLPKAKKTNKWSYRLQEEKVLMDLAREQVQTANPDWEITNLDN